MRLLTETLLITLAGMVFGLAANAMSSRGLSLTKDYKPRLNPPTSSSAQTQPDAPRTTNPADELESIIRQMERDGLHAIRHDEVVSTFHDPLYASEVYLFIDARDDAHYADGHIPGSFQLNHYYIDRYIDAVLPAAQAAIKVVIYCNGGKCEDSESTAVELLNRGLDSTKVFVYVGGMKQWRAHGLPLERGARNSGDIFTAPPDAEGSHE